MIVPYRMNLSSYDILSASQPWQMAALVPTSVSSSHPFFCCSLWLSDVVTSSAASFIVKWQSRFNDCSTISELLTCFLHPTVVEELLKATWNSLLCSKVAVPLAKCHTMFQVHLEALPNPETFFFGTRYIHIVGIMHNGDLEQITYFGVEILCYLWLPSVTFSYFWFL